MPRFGAFIPLLLFIFPGASSHCQTGTENECKKHTAFVPGHSLAGEGIDVTTMARKGAYLVDSCLWQHEDGTCTLCQNRLQGGQWQRLPLAAVDWRVRVSCRRKLSDSVQQSAMGMMESAASMVQNDWKVGLDVPVKPKVNVQVALAGSHSKLASFMVDHTRMDKYSFVSHAVSCSYYRPSLLPRQDAEFSPFPAPQSALLYSSNPSATQFKFTFNTAPLVGASEAEGSSWVGELMILAMPRFGAFIPLLLFIFPGASSHCHTSTENECEKHTAFVPGHSLAGEGIDVTTMARKGAYLVDSSLWQHEDGTCTLCRNRLQGWQRQRLPLAAVDWRVRVLCHRKLSSSVQQSAMGMMESAASAVQNDWKVGLDVPVKPKVNVQVALAGSHSKLASFMVDHTRIDKYSFVSHEVSCGYYT
ncbi:hypothetical protein KIL84_006299 [Mauremys mutica]|uniref:Perforin-1 n=1 Tax=Mauremys mutica TaxID=74926 RepID=A0A9D3X0P7_9SAUR|nr:hypothetical protein KIL84_006299 [Mauremys mutica]